MAVQPCLQAATVIGLALLANAPGRVGKTPWSQDLRGSLAQERRRALRKLVAVCDEPPMIGDAVERLFPLRIGRSIR
jgi:hypothetical protein